MVTGKSCLTDLSDLTSSVPRNSSSRTGRKDSDGQSDNFAKLLNDQLPAQPKKQKNCTDTNKRIAENDEPAMTASYMTVDEQPIAEDAADTLDGKRDLKHDQDKANESTESRGDTAKGLEKTTSGTEANKNSSHLLEASLRGKERVIHPGHGQQKETVSPDSKEEAEELDKSIEISANARYSKGKSKDSSISKETFMESDGKTEEKELHTAGEKSQKLAQPAAPITVTPKKKAANDTHQAQASNNDFVSTVPLNRSELNIEGYSTSPETEQKPSDSAEKEISEELLNELSKKPNTGWPEPSTQPDEALTLPSELNDSENTGWPTAETPDIPKEKSTIPKDVISTPRPDSSPADEMPEITDTHIWAESPLRSEAERTQIMQRKDSVSEKTHIIDKSRPSDIPPPAPSFFKKPPVPVTDQVKMTKYESETTTNQESALPKARILESIGGGKAQLNEGLARKATESRQAPAESPKSINSEMPDVRITGTINLPRGTHALKTIQKLSQRNLQAKDKKPVQAIEVTDAEGSKSDGIKSSGALKSTIAQTRPQPGTMNELVRAIRDQLPQLQTITGTRLNMDFTSSRFGELNITVSQQQGRLTVVIQSDSQSSQDSLSQSRDELNRQLRQLGYGEVNVEINNKSGENKKQSDGAQDEDKAEQNVRFLDDDGNVLEDYEDSQD